MLYLLWFACFASFGWATRRHFRNRGTFTAGMKWTFGLGTVFSLLQLVALATQQQSISAAICYSLSLSLFWWAIRTTHGKGFGACFASIESNELVTSGPYRWIRHPFYTSYLLAWIAGALTYAPLLFAVAVMGYLYWKAAEEEESRFCTGPRSAEYEAYRQRTGRFFISWTSRGKAARKAAA